MAPFVKETDSGVVVMDDSMGHSMQRTMSRQSLAVKFNELTDGQRQMSKMLGVIVVVFLSMFAIVILGTSISIDITKETTVKGGRLETIAGDPVEVTLVSDEACPLVQLLEKSADEVMTEKLVSFVAVDSDGAAWDISARVAAAAIKINLDFFSGAPKSATSIISTDSGGKLKIEKNERSHGRMVYGGTYRDSLYCEEGCEAVSALVRANGPITDTTSQVQGHLLRRRRHGRGRRRQLPG